MHRALTAHIHMHMHMHCMCMWLLMHTQVRALEALCTRAADASKRKSRDESRLVAAVWGGDESSTRRIHRRASTVSGQFSPASVFDEVETHGGGALALVRAGGDASRLTTLHSETDDMPPVTTSAYWRGVNVNSYSPSVVASVSNRSSARRASLGRMPPPQQLNSSPRAMSGQTSGSGWAARRGSRRLSLSSLGSLPHMHMQPDGDTAAAQGAAQGAAAQGAVQFKTAARLYDATTSGCDEHTRLQPYVPEAATLCAQALQPYVPRCDAFLIDLDGTMYQPGGLLPGAREFYRWLVDSGTPCVLPLQHMHTHAHAHAHEREEIDEIFIYLSHAHAHRSPVTRYGAVLRPYRYSPDICMHMTCACACARDQVRIPLEHGREERGQCAAEVPVSPLPTRRPPSAA